MPAIAIATSIHRVASHTPWRTLLFVTASAVALSASPKAAAQNECGAPTGTPPTVTCAVDPGGFANGITYSAAGDLVLNVDDAAIITRPTPGDGVNVLVTGGATINAPNVAITTTADASRGAVIATGAGGVTANLGGSISTAGANSAGLTALAAAGPINITSAMGITTTGQNSNGLVAVGTGGEGAPSAMSVTSTGAISATGLGSNGIVVVGPGDVTVDAGDTVATGIGVIAVAGGNANVTVSGNVVGGAVLGVQPLPTPLPADPSTTPPAFAGGVAIAGQTVTLTNNGSISALSDTALATFSQSTTTIDNSGDIAGYISLGAGDATFNNLGSLSTRNFSDTDGDGVRDTEAVAISDFGEGVDTFNNAAGGSVVLMNVTGATTIDPTGALVPGYGDPANYDITLEGVEQAHLANVEFFNNAGAINMQDTAGGGAAPVAGDVMAITGSAAGDPPVFTPALFTSEGGSLLLDTVLNEGGAIASQSDVLMLDAAATGAGGPTLVSIQNAGGLGAQTIENGILVVDVADPAASAADAFALNGITIAGPWQYQLFQGGDAAAGGDPADGNWYLRSNLAPTTDLYGAYPSSLMRTARVAVGTLQQRVGNRWWYVPEQRTQRTVTEPPPPPPPPSVRDFIVYFDWDRSEIREDAAATIREAAEYAKTGNAARILVVGHTDTSGSAEYNMGLSERRAQAVSSALQGEGVAAQIIGMEWLGETQPAVDTGDGVREQRNRRATIQVSVPGTPDPASMQPRTRTVEEVIPATVEMQGSGAWGRLVGVSGEYQLDDDSGDIEEDMWMAQAGADFVVSESEDSRVLVGFSIHYTENDTDVSTADFGDVGTIDSTGWGVSGSVTWYNQAGAYADGVISATWFESDLDSDALGGSLFSENEGFAWSISGEGGMRYQFRPNYYWVPQAQLIYTDVDIDGFTDPFGAEVDEADSDSLIGRLGVAFEYLNRSTDESGNIHRMQGYGIVNLLYEFLGQPGVSVSGIDLDEDIDDFWGEFGAGFTYSFNDQWSVYGEGSYRTAWENFGDSQALQGSIGLRYNW